MRFIRPWHMSGEEDMGKKGKIKEMVCRGGGVWVVG